MTSSKKGFILVEIIVSVLLLSITSIALLKVTSNQKRIYTLSKSKLNFSQYSSILTNRHNINFHKKNINLYEIIKKEYVIKNDKLMDILKNTNIQYTQEYDNTIELEDLNFLVDEIRVSNKKGVSKYKTVQM